jgi:hypothetical protein
VFPKIRSDDDVGHTDIVQHRIDLIDEKPFKQRYRRIPQAAYDDVRTVTGPFCL